MVRRGELRYKEFTSPKIHTVAVKRQNNLPSARK
jgi:hypothetical protein